MIISESGNLYATVRNRIPRHMPVIKQPDMWSLQIQVRIRKMQRFLGRFIKPVHSEEFPLLTVVCVAVSPPFRRKNAFRFDWYQKPSYIRNVSLGIEWLTVLAVLQLWFMEGESRVPPGREQNFQATTTTVRVKERSDRSKTEKLLLAQAITHWF